MVSSEEVKYIRRMLKLRQRELADLIGVSINTIQNYEKGGVIPVSKQKLLMNILEELQSNINPPSGSYNIIGNSRVNDINIGVHPERYKEKKTNNIDKILSENERLKNELDLLKRSIKDKEEIIDFLREENARLKNSDK